MFACCHLVKDPEKPGGVGGEGLNPPPCVPDGEGATHQLVPPWRVHRVDAHVSSPQPYGPLLCEGSGRIIFRHNKPMPAYTMQQYALL